MTLKRIPNPRRSEESLNRIVVYKCNSQSKFKYLIMWGTSTLEYNAAVLQSWSKTVDMSTIEELISTMRQQKKPKVVHDDLANVSFDTFMQSNDGEVFVRRLQ